MRIILINDTAARSANPGCQLTSRTFRAFLDRLGKVTESIEWGFSRRMPAVDRRTWHDLLAGRWLDEPVLRNLAQIEYGPDAAERCRRADLIVFQPEGTVSDNENALRIMRFLSLPLWAALYAQAPVIVANGTFPLLSDHRAGAIRALLSCATLTVMRDRISAQHWNVPCAPDSAVLWQGIPRKHDPQWLLVTTAAEANIRIDLAIGQAALSAAQALRLRPLILGKAWQHLLPLEDRIKALGGEILTSTELDHVDPRIADCRLHIGGRYHMALLCATKGIPSALIPTNTHKNIWLEQEIIGIALSQEPHGLAAAAAQLMAVPQAQILADTARLRDETVTELSAMRATARREHHDPLVLPEDLLRALKREARVQLWKQRLRRLR